MATKHAVLIRSTRASASSAAQRRPSRFIASNSSGVTFRIRIRLEWNVKRSDRILSRARNIAGISVSIVELELGTISPMQYVFRLIRLNLPQGMYSGNFSGLLPLILLGQWFRLASSNIATSNLSGSFRTNPDDANVVFDTDLSTEWLR